MQICFSQFPGKSFSTATPVYNSQGEKTSTPLLEQDTARGISDERVPLILPFDVREFPSLVEISFLRPIKAEYWKPAVALDLF